MAEPSVASSLRHEIAEFFGRALVVVRGADDARLAAERALARGDATGALGHARELLARVPGSPLGLLLAADAAESAWLDETAAEYLTELAAAVPWSDNVWLRLGLARLRAGAPLASARDALARATLRTEVPETAARAAVALAELDLAHGDAARALVWVNRVATDALPEALVLRALALLELGDVDGARTAAAHLPTALKIEGTRALVDGRLAAIAGPAGAAKSLLRAYILDAPGAARALADAMPVLTDDERERVRRIVTARGEIDQPLFEAAFALAQGDRSASRRALTRAAERGDADAAKALVRVSTEDRDANTLRVGLATLADRGVERPAVEASLLSAVDALADGELSVALGALEAAGEHPWARALREEVTARMAPRDAHANVAAIVGELRRAARVLDDAAAIVEAEGLAVEAERPLRAAIVGEFNAGKSTFLNALLSADIAPTGVLPTTATLHHVVFSPDAFARVALARGPDRVVSPERLRDALREVRDAGGEVTRVTLGAPLERLRRIEILDTPGFNAPDAAHGEAARGAFDEAHVALWIIDATQPLKESERAVLADAHGRGVPVQILVNKADRVDPDALRVALAYVERGLDAAGLRSLAPPVAFSARLALAGRLGDTEALVASHWHEVEALVESTLVAGADRLKDAALRRRARALAIRLLVRARELAGLELSTARAEAAERAAWLDAGARLLHDRAGIRKALERALIEPRVRLLEDLGPLDRGGANVVQARSYAASRVVLRFALPTAEALVASLPELAPYARSAARLLLPVVTATLHGIAAGVPSMSDMAGFPSERLLDALAEPAAASLREGPPAAARPMDIAPLVHRLEPLVAALGC